MKLKDAPKLTVVLDESHGNGQGYSFAVKRVVVDGVELPGVQRAVMVAQPESAAKLIVTLAGNIEVTHDRETST